MPSVFHTTTCALVGETIPAANDALLPPACPGFRPTTAQEHGIIIIIIIIFRS